jgi:hypothetical protein
MHALHLHRGVFLPYSANSVVPWMRQRRISTGRFVDVLAPRALADETGRPRRFWASISPWQFAHRRTHFFASSRNAARDLPVPIDIEKLFTDGSVW